MSGVEPLVLRAGDEKVLRGWLRSSRVQAGLAQRARILVLAAEGHRPGGERRARRPPRQQ